MYVNGFAAIHPLKTPRLMNCTHSLLNHGCVAVNLLHFASIWYAWRDLAGPRQKVWRDFMLLLFGLWPLSAVPYTVSNLSAFTQHGQVFLTWTNPAATNLQYCLYKSATPIVSSEQLTAATYRGFVRDYSGKNVRKSLLKNKDFYLVIQEGGAALASNQGLYVATTTDNGLFYYCVTVIDLSTGIEDKTVIPGANSLTAGVWETIAKPQPVLQTITNQNNGDISYEYVVWGDNYSSPVWPAFNNVGSYGYMFTLQKRGVTDGQPLFVKFVDQSPIKKVDEDLCTNCNMLQPDDWLPNGSNTYWIGYNNSYNMYVPNYENPKVSSGVVHAYTQKRLREILLWARRQPGVDSNRVYFQGKSHNGFGAMITALNNPDIVSAFYTIVAPFFHKTVSGDRREYTFCKASSNLPTDITYPGTNDSILIWDLCDSRTYYNIYKNTFIPFGQGIHGRNDTKIGWVQSKFWYDSLDRYQHGGLWYWDRRKHNGKNADFTSTETQPDYLRFANNRSYPAFSKSTSNHNPGNGSSTDGDPYGAFNAYMDWSYTSIVDQPCQYSIYCFLRTFYVGGQPDSRQYDTCRADLTIRRAQHFKPLPGQQIQWTNTNANNEVVQSGIFTYAGGALTIPFVKFFKTGGTITLTLVSCNSRNHSEAITHQLLSHLRVTPQPIADFAQIRFTLRQQAQISYEVIDESGRRIYVGETEILPAGDHVRTWKLKRRLPSGSYLLRLRCNDEEFVRILIVS